MKKLLITIIVLAVLGGGAFFLLKGDSKKTDTTTSTQSETAATPTVPTESTSPAADSATVTYNGTAFSPAKITVQPGTTVKFVNQSSSPMWVASDPHPVHTDFSEFDAKKSSGQGQTYSFTFEEAGTYDYHNHLNSGSTGTVTVQ